MTDFSGTELRNAFGQYLTGVTVVTTTNNGIPLGFTANSFTSVSLDPPLLLVCPGKHMNSYDVFESTDYFAVNILADDQQSVSNTFSRAGDDRFAHVPFKLDAQGSPIIDGVCAAFSCRVHQRIDAGDHVILLGEVLSFANNGRQGLGFCSNGYFSLAQERQANTPQLAASTGIAGAMIEQAGRLLVESHNGQLRFPSRVIPRGEGARQTVLSHFASLGQSVSIEQVYSVFNDVDTGDRYTFFKGLASSSAAIAPGVFLPIDSLPVESFSDAAQRQMAERFREEYRNNAFGLYVGNSLTGEVHPNHHSRTDKPS